MSTERKYRKQVNRNGWMARLQKFTFGKLPKFTGYCPFFWVTWFCLLALPITLVIHAIAAVGRRIRALVKSLPSPRPSDELLIKFYNAVAESSLDEVAENWDGFDSVFAWIKQHPDWENCALAAIARRDAKLQRLAEREARPPRVLKFATKYSGLIVKTFLGGLILALIVLLSHVLIRAAIGLFLMLSQLQLATILDALEVVVAAAAILTVAYLLGSYVKGAYRKYRKCPANPHVIGVFVRAWDAIGDLLVTAAEFVFETIATIYTKECPLIEWGDEGGPIKRNE